MKIALLSFVDNLNFGGCLQMFALQRAIALSYPNIECEYLHYVQDKKWATIKWLVRKVIYGITKKDDNPSWTICEFIRIIKHGIYEKRVGKASVDLFEEFWGRIQYSRHLSKKQLYRIEDEYDFFIVGSDQVWNCGRLNLDTTYFLDFINNRDKKGCYAPSLALKEIPSKYYAKYYTYLSQFKYLSCRESSGTKMLEQLLHRKVVTVVDPVFLLDKEEWKKVINQDMGVQMSSEQYILIYQLEADCSNPLEVLARWYQKKYKWKIKKVYGDFDKNDNIGPAEWLALFYNADMILTDSFHGTAFSIIFEKQFISYIPDKDFYQSSSGRITDLLNALGFNERLYDSKIDFVEPKEIDYEWEGISKRLRALIMQSREYLFSMLENRYMETKCVNKERKMDDR